MAIRFFSKSENYRDFSNFAPYPINLDGARWPTVEHYYQAQKFEDAAYRKKIRQSKNAPEAKARGRKQTFPVRADWDAVKDEIMYGAVTAKFTQHGNLAELLLATGEEEIIESAPADYYWGEGADGTGQNKLGKILERVRAELRENRTD